MASSQVEDFAQGAGRRYIEAVDGYCRFWLLFLFFAFSEGDAARIADVACHIGTNYWLASEDDYRLDRDPESLALKKAQALTLARAPLAYESADRNVRLYDIRRLTQADCALRK